MLGKKKYEPPKLSVVHNPQHNGNAIVIAPSSDDIADDLRKRIQAEINTAVADKRQAAINEAINEYYTKKAKSVFVPLWRECARKTGHSYEVDKNETERNRKDGAKVCRSCGHPIGPNTRHRKQTGFSKLGWKLREADQVAGIEYIPTKI